MSATDRAGARSKGGPGPYREERRMDEQKRRARELDALEVIAEQLERLRVLKEHELGVRVEEVEGDLYVKPIEK
jgi:hypothetical protein